MYKGNAQSIDHVTGEFLGSNLSKGLVELELNSNLLAVISHLKTDAEPEYRNKEDWIVKL